MELTAYTDTLNPAVIAEIAALEPVDATPIELRDHTTNFEGWRADRDRNSYVKWLNAAIRLARLGVAPCPSHRTHTNHRTGQQHTTVSSAFGAFWDADDLHRHSGIGTDPLLLWGFNTTATADHIAPLPAGWPWIAVAHQTAGTACHHQYFIGLVCTPDDGMLDTLRDIARFADRDGHDCIGIGGVSLTELAEYHAWLTAHGLTADATYRNLEEGCYPLDERHAPLLTSTTLPTYDELWSRDDDTDRVAGAFRRAGHPRTGMWVLAENCD